MSLSNPSMKNRLNVQAWPLQTKLMAGILSGLVVEILLAVIGLTAATQPPPVPNSGTSTPVVIILIVILTAGLVMLALFWAMLSTHILHPLQAIVASLEQIEQGDYGTALSAPNQDIIGNVAVQVNKLRTVIQNTDDEAQQTVERQVHILSMAITIGQAMSSIRSPDAVLKIGAEALCSAFQQVNYARVYLPNNSDTQATIHASAGLELETNDPKLSAQMTVDLTDMNPVSQVYLNRRGMIDRLFYQGQSVLPTAEASPDFSNPTQYMAPGMRSRCLLPLLINGQAAGVLEMQSSREDAFATSDLYLFQSVADQMASALQSAELFEDLQIRLREVELINSRLTGRTWREYTLKRRTTIPRAVMAGSDMEGLEALPDQDLSTAVWRESIERDEYVERIEADQVRFAVPIRLSGQVLGAAEWVIPRDAYTPSTRQLAESLTGRLALVADNIRLLEQSQTQTARERLLNNISSKLMQQVDVEQILQTAVLELGQALRVSQAVIRLDENLTRT